MPAAPVASALRVALVALLALAVQAGWFSPPATAATRFVPGGGAEMSLAFGAGETRLVGSTALVPVRCLGSRSGLCNGVVTLVVRGHRHTAPFALSGGSAQDLAVPVGRRAPDKGTAMATATTVLATGGYSRTADLLRFRG